MADLNFLQRSNPVQIVGGDEANPVDVNDRKELQVSEEIKVGGVEGAITVGTTAIEAKVGISRYGLRKLLTVYNNGDDTIYYGFNSNVTVSSGTPLARGEFVSVKIGDAAIWLIAAAPQNARVTEAR